MSQIAEEARKAGTNGEGMSEANELARHLINRNVALRMSEDLNMPEILEAYDRHMEAQRIDQAQTAFAKDIARQCVGMDIRQKSLAKGIDLRARPAFR